MPGKKKAFQSPEQGLLDELVTGMRAGDTATQLSYSLEEEMDQCATCGFGNAKGATDCLCCGKSLEHDPNNAGTTTATTTNTTTNTNDQSTADDTELSTSNNIGDKPSNFSDSDEDLAICGSCNYGNREGSVMCELCGHRISQRQVQPKAKLKKSPTSHLPRPCAACRYENEPGTKYCSICGTNLGDDPWVCPRCKMTNSSHSVECYRCNNTRPAHTLEGRVVEAGLGATDVRIPIESDWVLFPEARKWVEGVSRCTLDTSDIIGMDDKVKVPSTLPDGAVYPNTKKEEETLRTLKEGDAVRTREYDERMKHQRCGWGEHLKRFCGEDAEIVKVLTTEDGRAQALVRFTTAKLDKTIHIPEDRRNTAWFDYEWIECLSGTRLPVPPGGWYDQLLKFPLSIGDTVRIRPYDPLMQRMKCGWDARMKELIGKPGVITRILVTSKFAQVNLGFQLPNQQEATSWWDIEWLDIPPYLVDRNFHCVTTGLCSGTITVKAVNVRQCPSGHECRWVTNPYRQRGGSVECEGCRRSSIRNEEVLHCAICEYDLCKSCARVESVIERTSSAIRTLSTIVWIGDLPQPWLEPITKRLQQKNDKIALRRTELACGRPALHICVMGDVNMIAGMFEGQFLCKVHGETFTAGGTKLTNPISKVDQGVLHAIERAFECSVVTPPPDPTVHQGTAAFLGAADQRTAAASKLVWYSASRRTVIRVHPLERGVILRKLPEIRKQARCHVSLDHGCIIKLIGLPDCVRVTKQAIQQLLSTHRHELQKARADKVMSAVVSELCEVRLQLRITDALKAVLSQLHEPNSIRDGRKKFDTSKKRQTIENQSRQIRKRLQEELNEIHKVSSQELQKLCIPTTELSIPTNIAGIRAFHVGDQVVRGADWEWDDQDGGLGQVGRVFDFPLRNEMHEGGLVDGFLGVEWPNGSRYNYRVGREQSVVHATQEGENLGQDDNDEEEISKRILRHKQIYLNLVNSVGALEVRNIHLIKDFEPPEVGSKRDVLQQHLHQTTRDKARVEHAVGSTNSFIAREDERSRKTLSAIKIAKEEIDAQCSTMTPEQLQASNDLLIQHLENLRSLRAKMHRHSDTVTIQLASQAAKIRRELEEEIKLNKFSGWDIILSIMQETGALIEYKSGDDKLILTGGEPAVHAARQKLKSLTVLDLYAWSRVSARIYVSEEQYTQLTKLQNLLTRIIEQVSAAESVRTEKLIDEERYVVSIDGTRPQIEKAAEVLKQRVSDGDQIEIIWSDDSRKVTISDQSLIKEEGVVNLNTECDVCCEELTSSNTISLLCGHVTSCVFCLKQWIDSSLSQHLPASCPTRECKHVFTAGEYRVLQEMTALEGEKDGISKKNTDYETTVAKEKLRSQTVDCHSCESGFAIRSDENDMLPISCLECRSLICPNGSCSEPAHYFLDCSEVVPKRREMLLRKRSRIESPEERAEVDICLARIDETFKTQEVLKVEMEAAGETRPCPACGALVHKTGGCNSMRCNCGQRFCHLCLSTNCELVEVAGAKVPCTPDKLKERIESALATFQGSTVYVGWLSCDICDKYPLSSDEKVFACPNCVNLYVCSDCEAKGKDASCHPSDHFLVEISQRDEPEHSGRIELPLAGPDYDIDWEAVRRQSKDQFARTPESGDSQEPVEVVTPITGSLELQSGHGMELLDPPPLAPPDGFDDVGLFDFPAGQEAAFEERPAGVHIHVADDIRFALDAFFHVVGGGHHMAPL
eukprot:TRINITY_DN2145_c1_g1_i5.p1 TRINITY_DN2145_c1_g1~~TRINITY_DN2145_c1_g1_i5.p1  ORF type:complete len:1723 (+),score=324.17 TRINITY_DN2145_c1_g1_i5:86-5254(+)